MEAKRSLRTSDFKKQLSKLPVAVQEEAQSAFEKWLKSPQSVDFKALDCAGDKACNAVYSARINYRYRALSTELVLSEDTSVMLWFWVGSREEYDKKKKSAELQRAQRNVVSAYTAKFEKAEALARLAVNVAALSARPVAASLRSGSALASASAQADQQHVSYVM